MTANPSDGASNVIRFLLDGEPVSAHQPCTMTVLEYLREVLHRTGTKEGCAEGDCGACTVVLGRLAVDGGRVDYRAINSCIRFLPTIDGHELVTVESLSARDGRLHPVQQAMVDHHASQCGFCTPGFVMSLFALYLRQAAAARAPLTRAEVVEALAGNLCRCTGYRPIIEAGIRMGDYPSPAHWGPEAPADIARCNALRGLQRDAPLRLPEFFAPRSVDELAAALEHEPESLVLAGGTDVGLMVTKQLRELPAITYIGEVAELKQIRRATHGIEIGAAVSLAEGWSALVAMFPTLAESAQRFGSPPVRNSGTLCGNLANGSPIGDAIPVLIALGADLELRRGKQTRRLALEDFYLGYQRKDLAAGEFVVSVTVPTPEPGLVLASYKVSKRFEQDISGLSAAFAVQLRDRKIACARIAFGGMAATPKRASATERVLVGADWSLATIESAVAKLAEDFQPMTDFRASSDYRMRTADNLLRRFYLEHGADAQPRGQPKPTRTADALAATGRAR